MEINPFIYGKSLMPQQFIGRKRQLQQLFSRLVTGQSVALIGQPHIGKTSLLNLIFDEDKRQEIAGSRLTHDCFCFVDAHMLRGIETQAEFWQQALAPLAQVMEDGQMSALLPLYATAAENKFSTFVLEQLFQALGKAGSRLVLLLDEFDDFLGNDILHKAEFYGGLRSLASRSSGLVLLIATRRDLEQLNQLTQEINPHGSPYFNVFTEIHLGPLAQIDLATLLKQADSKFNQEDRHFVADLSGYHPYLAQAAAAILWEADEDGLTGNARYHTAADNFYRETSKHFADTWRFWTNETRRAVTAVSLTQIPYLAPGRVFEVSRLVKHLDDYTPELDKLEANGLVARDNNDVWRVRQAAFLWWLAEQLWKAVRDESDFEVWLQQQTMDGIFTRQERQWMKKAAKESASAVGKGINTFIEAYAKQLAGGSG